MKTGGYDSKVSQQVKGDNDKESRIERKIIYKLPFSEVPTKISKYLLW